MDPIFPPGMVLVLQRATLLGVPVLQLVRVAISGMGNPVHSFILETFQDSETADALKTAQRLARSWSAKIFVEVDPSWITEENGDNRWPPLL